MKTLLKNAHIVNVFTDELEKKNVLIDGEMIIGVGDYCESDIDVGAGDIVRNLEGKYICPGFIDGHIHIESTMLTPAELAKAIVPHGTTAIIADPHEIANVAGSDGIRYMLGMSSGIPLLVFIMLPSCVPSGPFDESGAVLEVENIEQFLSKNRVRGLAEVMNYPGVIAGDKKLMAKIDATKSYRKVIDGHAPLVTGKDLDKYIAAGIKSDHECTSFEEARERICKGQTVMIREGTAARNLEALLPLFDEPYNRRCMLVTDDLQPADIIKNGHIDNIIRLAVKAGKSPLAAIRMASYQAAQHFEIWDRGAIAPGYVADILVLDDIESVDVRDVYLRGELWVEDKLMADFPYPEVAPYTCKVIKNSFYMNDISESDFHIEAPEDAQRSPDGRYKARVINVIPGSLMTDESIESIDLARMNGVDTERDILKLAVMERHLSTGHIGLGFIKGMGIKHGAIASSVSHDSHNLIVVGTNEKDMAVVAECVKNMGGGMAVADNGKIVCSVALPLGGLMTEKTAAEVAADNAAVRAAALELGNVEGIMPFMNMGFVSLLVIPHIKMSTQGYINVDTQERVSLWI